MKIEAWKCQTTGKLFEVERDFTSHKRKLSRAKTVQLKKQQNERTRLQAWTDLQNEEFDISQLAPKLLARQDEFWPDYTTTKLTNLKFQLAWCDSVSNTHFCPKSGMHNWHCHKELPKGYPGWHGRIWWETSAADNRSDDHRFGLYGQCIHTGTANTGSGCSTKTTYTYSYEVLIFADDWKGLATYRDKENMWEALK